MRDSRVPSSRTSRRVFLACALILFFAAGARASLLDKLQWKVEKHFGRTTVEEMRGAYGFVENPLLRNYIENVGSSLAARSHRADIPYEFYIVDTDEVNAFAAPGGFVFVTRGLMEKAASEDELAAVVGHEIGHVAARHGMKNIKKMPFILAGAAILAGKTDETTQRLAGMAFSLMQLHYSREDEYEADSLGAGYVSAADFDPAGMISFFKKLEREQPTGRINRLEVAISSHPKTTSRMARIAALPALQPSTDNLLRVADSYMNRLYFNKAKEKYLEAFALDPQSARAAAGVGSALLETGAAEAAGNWFALALRLDPAHGEAARGLARAESATPVPAASFAGDSAAPVSTVNTALAHVNKNLPHLEEALALAGKFRPEIDAASDEIRKSLIKNLKSYSSIAKNFTPGLDPRADVVAAAAAGFNGVMSLADTLQDIAGDIPATALFAARRSREISYRLEHSPRITPAAAAAAEDLDTVVSEFVVDQDDARKTLLTTADRLDRIYKDNHDVMGILSDTLNEENRDNINYYSRRLADRLERSAEDLEKISRETEETALYLDLQRLRMKRAILNFDAALLSPPQELVFQKMLTRRFGIAPESLNGRAGLPIGYADALLLASRAGSEKKSAGAKPETFDPSAGPLDKFLINEKTDVAAGLLLMSLAEADLLDLTGRAPAADLEREPLPTAAAVAASSGESEDSLLRAAEALDAGRPEEAASIIHERGKSQKATALSHLLLGMAANALDNPSDSLAEFKYSLKKNGNSTHAHFLLAAAFADLERFGDAANEFSAALKLAPEDSSLAAATACNDAALGRTASALEALKNIAASGGDNPRVYLNLGILYYQEGYIGEAVEAFKNFLRLDPSRTKLATLVEILEST